VGDFKDVGHSKENAFLHTTPSMIPPLVANFSILFKKINTPLGKGGTFSKIIKKLTTIWSKKTHFSTLIEILTRLKNRQ
jgi:hypothetical protein